MTHVRTKWYGRRFLLSSAFAAVAALAGFAPPEAARGGDWPQWRGPNRDGHATDFKAPKEWPKELTQKWKVTVGDGVATPALVGDKLFVFTREGDSEVVRCLDAGTGKEVWIEKYNVAFRPTADAGFPGPRCSPAVADGKVVTMGVNGMLSCFDAASGKKVWQTQTEGMPPFHTSSSPIIVNKVAVTQYGGEGRGKGGAGGGKGGVAAYELETGKEKWKWTGAPAAYASPVSLTIDGTTMIVAETASSIVGLNATDGKELWKINYPVTGGRGYNSSTPVVMGSTVIFSGSNRGTKALRVEKDGDKFTAKEVWANPDNSALYNTPVVHGKSVFGLTSSDKLFCVNAETGKTEWTEPLSGGRGYGNIVDAGSVLLALPPTGTLTVFEPSDKEFRKLASYKVGASKTYAYPIATGNRIFVKDVDSVILWTVE